MAYRTLNPASGEFIESFPDIGDGAFEETIACAQHCFENDWPRRPVPERCTIMARAAARLRETAEEHACRITIEMGKPIRQARGEVLLAANILDYYARQGESFLRPRELPDVPGAMLHTQPIGIVLAIVTYGSGVWPARDR